MHQLLSISTRWLIFLVSTNCVENLKGNLAEIEYGTACGKGALQRQQG